MAYADDMLQEETLTYCMITQRANCGCRFVLLSPTGEHRSDLAYDAFIYGRHHKQTVSMRSDMNALRTKASERDHMLHDGMIYVLSRSHLPLTWSSHGQAIPL
jgi:hypothetical protein